MTAYQKFKEKTYSQMLGGHRAKFMIESFYLDYDAGTLMVTYSKGKDTFINVDPEEYSDIYAFEKELREKLVIGAVPEKECWGEPLEESMLHFLVKNHMNDFVYITDKTLDELCNSIGYPRDYVLKGITTCFHICNSFFLMLKSEAEHVKLPVAYNYCVKLPVKPVSETELAFL